MPELLLHIIWFRGLFRDFPQQTTDGLAVEVVDPGQHNPDAGPDFSAAQLRIGGQLIAGNVEIHVKSSDWYNHGHQSDPAYDSVVLHVVRTADREVRNSKGRLLPQLELRYPSDSAFMNELLTTRYAELGVAQCALQPSQTAAHDWRKALLEDRILKKTLAIRQLLHLSTNNWEQAFYITLAHNFGFHTNGLPFELLAKQTPLPFLLKHRSSLFQLQAMLLGQSGLLAEPFFCRLAPSLEKAEALQREYAFLQKKFTLQPLDGSLWKYARLRPQNFPHVRILQFAALVYTFDNLLSRVLDAHSLRDFRSLFSAPYADGQNGPALGRSSVDSLIVNVAVPYKYAWGRAHACESLCSEAYALLEQLPAEKNGVVEQWKALGVEVRTAADSQAFIHLYQEYCLRQRCLECDLGFGIFTPEK